MESVNQSEFRLTTPEVFQGLDIRYGETRRDSLSDNPMSGNTTESEAIISQAYEAPFTLTTDSPLYWVAQRKSEARTRVEHMRRLLGFQAGLVLPRPVHGTHLINADTEFKTIKNDLPLEERAPGDAVVNRVPGRGSIYNPADCILANVAFYRLNRTIATAQIHAGWKGLRDDIIGKTLHELCQTDLLSTDAVVYISPHAHAYTLRGDSLANIVDAGLGQYLDTSLSDKEPIFDMTSLARDQLESAGIRDIQISSDDSMIDQTLYSHYLHGRNPNAPIGRNGVALGLRSPQ